MIKANTLQSDNYLGDDLAKLNRVLVLLESTLNSNEFQTSVLNFQTFSYTIFNCRAWGLFGKLGRTASQLPVYSNQQVLNKILGGHSSSGGDTFMDLKLVLSQDNEGDVVGQTSDDFVTTTYVYWFHNFTDVQVAAHYLHEYTHTLGFQHSFSDKCDDLRDCFSVPYGIQAILELQLSGTSLQNCTKNN